MTVTSIRPRPVAPEIAEVAVAVCALVAAADGTLGPWERRQMAELIRDGAPFGDRGPSDLDASFDRWCDLLLREPEVGRSAALATIGTLRGSYEAASSAMYLAVRIATADGHVDRREAQAIEDAWLALGLRPAHLAF